MNYPTVVGEDTCKLGKTFAYVMNTQVSSGDIAFMGGFPGNPLSPAGRSASSGAEPFDPRNRERPDELGSVQGPGHRRRHPRQVPGPEGLSYEDGALMSQGGYAAYKAAGIPYQGVFTYRTDEVAMGCLADKLKNKKLKICYYTSGNPQIRVALTADMMKLATAAKIPPTIVFPIQLQQQSKRDMCIKGYPPGGLRVLAHPAQASCIGCTPRR